MKARLLLPAVVAVLVAVAVAVAWPEGSSYHDGTGSEQSAAARREQVRSAIEREFRAGEVRLRGAVR